jgi:hypothetical protein
MVRDIGTRALVKFLRDTFSGPWLVLQRHFFIDNQDEFMYHGFSKGE